VRRERELAEMRRRAAQHERLASLTTLAAGAAHELATPLASISVAAGELERTVSAAGDAALLDDIRLIRSQVRRCRVILDQTGAERLVGLGDMLLSTPALAKPKRIQGAFVTEDEIHAVVDHLKKQAEPDYHEEILHLKVAASGGGVEGPDGDDDPLIWEAADIIVTSRMGSTSLLQRRLKVGYARAGRIMDMLEQKGVVGPPDGSKPRDVLVDIEDLESIKVFERHDAADE